MWQWGWHIEYCVIFLLLLRCSSLILRGRTTIVHASLGSYCRLIIAEITLLLIGHTLIGQLAEADKKESRLYFTATLVDASRHPSAYPDMSSALEPSGSRRFTSLKESRQVLRVRLLAACQNVVIVYTHPGSSPRSLPSSSPLPSPFLPTQPVNWIKSCSLAWW